MAKRRSPAKRSGSKKKGKRKKSESAGWRRSPITGGLAGVIIIVCLFFLFRGGGGGNGNYKMDMICENASCNLDRRLERPSGETTTPYTCPDCDQKTMYQAQLCTNPECGKHTPLLPAKIDMTCTSCKAHGVFRLDPMKGPHTCSKCSAKALSETYECQACKHTFGHQHKSPSDTDSMEEFMLDGYMDYFTPIKCPKCSKEEAISINDVRIPSCKHCDSTELKSITPVAVIKWELGRDLNSKEEKIVEQWKAKQK